MSLLKCLLKHFPTIEFNFFNDLFHWLKIIDIDYSYFMLRVYWQSFGIVGWIHYTLDLAI